MTSSTSAPAQWTSDGTRRVSLGLRANWRQFAALVTVNFFVGGMVGPERSILPVIGAEEFGLAPNVVLFAFIAAFGITKAFANFVAGVAADRSTRKAVLVVGWVVGLPVPFILGYAPSWWMIVAANVLLGINQGLAWSMAVNMKIDLAGPDQRGLAMGLNEAAGYTAVGITALLTGYVAAATGLRPEPFWIGVAYALAGLAMSALVVRDTGDHARREAALHHDGGETATRSSGWVFAETSWKNRTLFGASQAGLVNNLNDGLSWGVLPVLFAGAGVGLADIGLLKAVYPIVWGLGQTITGPMADRFGRRPLVVAGMVVQSLGLATIGFGMARPFASGMVGTTLLGVGTAMAYPALLAAVGDTAHPAWRATSVGVYRFWRDIGYAVGAVVAGIVASAVSLVAAVHLATALTFASGMLAWRTSTETRPKTDAPTQRRDTDDAGRDDDGTDDDDLHVHIHGARAGSTDRGGGLAGPHAERRRPLGCVDRPRNARAALRARRDRPRRVPPAPR